MYFRPFYGGRAVASQFVFWIGWFSSWKLTEHWLNPWHVAVYQPSIPHRIHETGTVYIFLNHIWLIFFIGNVIYHRCILWVLFWWRDLNILHHLLLFAHRIGGCGEVWSWWTWGLPGGTEKRQRHHAKTPIDISDSYNSKVNSNDKG